MLSAAALHQIRHAFGSPEPDAVRFALSELAAAEPRVPWLLEGLLDPNRGVREWSAHALGDLAPQDDAVVRALVICFEDPDDYVRWKAARALGRIGWRARVGFPLLAVAAAAKDEVEVVRASARVAIQQLRRAAKHPSHAGDVRTLPPLAPWEQQAAAKSSK